MAQSGISFETLQFLRDLGENNNREWFNSNKDRYLVAHENMISFVDELIQRMNSIDSLVPVAPKKSLFRIYRDIRFSNDKTPYKRAFSGRMKRASERLRGGYYYRIQPGGESAIVGGFWKPESADLKRVRHEIGADASGAAQNHRPKTVR